MDRTIEQRVKAVVGAELAHSESAITERASFVEDLGADSLDSFGLVSALEAEFGVEIANHDLPHLQTVGELVRYIQEKVGSVSGYGHGV